MPLFSIIMILVFVLPFFLYKNNNILKQNDDESDFNNLMIESVVTDTYSKTIYMSMIDKVTSKQKIYVWGEDEKGNFGDRQESKGRSYDHPVEITNGGYFIKDGWKLTKMDTNGGTTAMLFTRPEDNSTMLYSWGNNNHGQLGYEGKADEEDHSTPYKIKFFNDKNIKDFFVGNGDIGVVTVDINGNDHLFMWGSNGSGQLGLGDEKDRYAPTEVPMSSFGGDDAKIKKVEGDADNTYAIVQERGVDNLYAWGSNGSGELGLGDDFTEKKYSVPQQNKLILDKTITSIDVGGYFTIISTNDGYGNHLYSWGKNNCGQLGLGSESLKTQYYNSPQEIKLFGEDGKIDPKGWGEIISINLGEGSSSIIVKTNDGNHLYSWGYNNHGQLGLGNKTDESSPKEVVFNGGLEVNQIYRGWRNSFVIASNNGNNYLFSTGSNEKGKLGAWKGDGGDFPSYISVSNAISISHVSIYYDGRRSAIASVEVLSHGSGFLPLIPYQLDLISGDGEIVGTSKKIEPGTDIQKVYFYNMKRNYLYKDCFIMIHGTDAMSEVFAMENISSDLWFIILMSFIGIFILMLLIILIIVIFKFWSKKRWKRKCIELKYS